MRFLDVSALPSTPYIDCCLPLDGVDWAVTSDYPWAKNHCAAVCVTNLALWFAAQDPSLAALAESGSKEETFRAVHALVGNGPVAAIAGKARRYFSQKGFRLNRRRLWGARALREALRQGRPCALLLAGGPLDWHWVLAVGWREYPSGERYVRVADGWNRGADRFLPLPGQGKPVPVLISAAAYWLER